MKLSFKAILGATFSTIFLASFGSSAGAIFDAANVKTVFNPPATNEVFVPPGFDDLDEAEITFINHSSNSCFIKNFSMRPNVDNEAKIIRISNKALILKGDFCKSRDIATSTTLKIGELKAGTYKVEFETSEGQFKEYTKINIQKSKTEQKDDYEYAALDINGLTVKVDAEHKLINIQLPGTFPNGCYRFNEVKVIDNRSPNVIEILPIVEAVTDVCTQEVQFYNKSITIPYDVDAPTKKLLHMRSADGVAINRIVTLE